MNSSWPLKIGLVAIGLETYWEQFDGLKIRIEENIQTVYERISVKDADVINLGLIDNAEKALVAGHDLRKADIDILFIYITTYALSETVLPMVRRVNVPVIFLNLSPGYQIEYRSFNKLERTKMTGEWLAYCSACPVPELANVFHRAGIPFFQVTGVLQNDAGCWNEISEWIEAAHVASIMFHNRLGLIGHYYSGMLDVYTDIMLQLSTFGGHMQHLEADELTAIALAVDPFQVIERVEEIKDLFEVQSDCAEAELERAARTSIALDQLVERHHLGSIAYYYKGTGVAENASTISSMIVGTSLLTARNIPVAGEYEIKNAQAMKILDSFGAGGSFTEIYALDLKDDIVLMGHDGPGHIKIARGKVKIKPLTVYHGKVGQGLSVEMSVKEGPVTLLSVVEHSGKIFLLVAEGDSVSGAVLELGNTNSRYRFSGGARKFISDWSSHGPSHHCAVGTGHIASKLLKLGHLLGIDVIIIGQN